MSNKVLLFVVAGLDQRLTAVTPGLTTLGSFACRKPFRPVWPAVTSTMQATMTTGVLPEQHGIIANGLYAVNRPELHAHFDLSNFADFRKQVSFWEQSNTLLQAPRVWKEGSKQLRTAMLFWQNSMQGAADVVITPKPVHTPDGKTLTACWSNPEDLYSNLVAKLGPFPLHTYWGPMGGLASTQWIIRAAAEVWASDLADINLVYIPLLDYNLQRFGPDHDSVKKDLAALDFELSPLITRAREEGAHVAICGDYAMTNVNTVVMPNAALREAGLLVTRPDENGKLLVDYEKSAAFAMVDHQIAHVYVSKERKAEVLAALKDLPGVGRALSNWEELEELGIASERSGNIVLIAQPNAWFAYDWWRSDDEKPAWQFSVDIHRKPGYDPRELFFDPQKKCISQNAALVRGSHGVISDHPADWPVWLSDDIEEGDFVAAEDVADWLMS